MKRERQREGGWALVTGASGGIGYELSRILAQHGFNIILVSRNAGRLAEVAQELKEQFHIQSVILPKDLSGPGAAREIFSAVLQRELSIDMLINNAGFGDLCRFDRTDWEVQRQMLQVNIMGLAELTRLFLPEMIKRRSGRILNIGSTASFAPVPYMAVYGATKAFVLSFTEALSEELEGTGVTVTVLCPGVTETQFAARAKTGHTRLVRMNRMTAAHVAQIGFDAAMKGKRRVVPGWFNKILAASTRFSHPRAVTKFSTLLLRPRSED